MTTRNVDTLRANAQAAVTALCEDALDNEQTTVAFPDVEAIAEEVGLHVTALVGMVKAYGLTVVREKTREVRGFTSNSHDRWHGKGSCRSHGGSGWEQISGFAGRKG